MSEVVKVRSPDAQPEGRLYPQQQTWPCTAQTDALCQELSLFTFIALPFQSPTGLWSREPHRGSTARKENIGSRNELFC